MSNSTNVYEVSFTPKENQISEIEEWLIKEKHETGEGFYCNWSDIKSSYFDENLAVITNGGAVIGFVTWDSFNEKTARIQIAEIKPTYRNMGVGRMLIAELLNFLKKYGIVVVDLQCSPVNSEYAWKRFGFLEFPQSKNFNFSDGNKKIYSILRDHLSVDSAFANETIELWDDELYLTENILPKYIWNVEFEKESRELLNPIIYPAHYEWRLRWRLGNIVVYDGKVKSFKTEIRFGNFIVISKLNN